VTVHVTVVEPTGNRLPLAGEQLTVVGGVPPTTVAGPYETVTGCPDGELVVSGAGHTSEGGAGACDAADVELEPELDVEVDVGAAGVPLHPTATRLEAAARTIRE
jgi:hypothetical protein